MWIETILSKEDLTTLAIQFMPLELKLSERGELAVSDPTDITLVPGVGLRLVCKAKLHWPVLGIVVPVTLNSLTIVLRPEMVQRTTGDALVFKVEIEHADIAGVPTMIDDKITAKVNEELAAKHVELSWGYPTTLSHVFKLPAAIAPIDTFEIDVARGKVVVTENAVTLAFSFHATVTRLREATPVPPSGVTPPDA